MKRLYFGVLIFAGVGFISLLTVLFAPELLGFLAQQEAEETRESIQNRQRCSSLNAQIIVLEGNTNVRNTGSYAFEEAELSWENSSGEYVESMKSLRPGNTKGFSTPGIMEATVSVPGCEKDLAVYSRGS